MTKKKKIFIGMGVTLADALASFSIQLPDFVRPLLENTIKTIKKFKINTKCK